MTTNGDGAAWLKTEKELAESRELLRVLSERVDHQRRKWQVEKSMIDYWTGCRQSLQVWHMFVDNVRHHSDMYTRFGGMIPEREKQEQEWKLGRLDQNDKPIPPEPLNMDLIRAHAALHYRIAKLENKLATEKPPTYDALIAQFAALAPKAAPEVPKGPTDDELIDQFKEMESV